MRTKVFMYSQLPELQMDISPLAILRALLMFSIFYRVLAPVDRLPFGYEPLPSETKWDKLRAGYLRREREKKVNKETKQ